MSVRVTECIDCLFWIMIREHRTVYYLHVSSTSTDSCSEEEGNKLFTLVEDFTKGDWLVKDSCTGDGLEGI